MLYTCKNTVNQPYFNKEKRINNVYILKKQNKEKLCLFDAPKPCKNLSGSTTNCRGHQSRNWESICYGLKYGFDCDYSIIGDWGINVQKVCLDIWLSFRSFQRTWDAVGTMVVGFFFNKRKREMPHTLLLEYSKIHNTYSNMKGYEKSYSKSYCLSLFIPAFSRQLWLFSNPCNTC